ncbi:hypothetical protein MLD52_01170 [Puniceicoccaceae bacterium K14]|nr:hypothetical protein [Puniceicoccaceae bacterium K14]
MKKIKVIALIAFLLLGVIAAFLYVKETGSFPSMEEVQVYLESLNPFLFFASMAILPAFGVPVSPFLVVAGAVYPLGLAIVGSVGALSLNMFLTWLVSGYWLRPFCERGLRRLGFDVPTLKTGEFVKVAIMLRLAPGIPFALQNYLLGVARMPLVWYLAVSVPIAAAIDIGIIVFGDALLSGDWVMIMGAICLIILMSFLVHSVRERMKKKSEGLELG